jgi:hypothetical protein
VPKDPEVWWRMQRIQAAPPGLREVYSFLTGAGNFAMVTPGIDVLARWLRREDPTKGLEEFRKESQAAFYASPLAHFVGQGFGLAGLGGLAARGLMAKGAELGAKGAAEQFLAGLRAFARPAAAGGAAGAVAGAAVGAATGRDPVADAIKFGVLGATAGLGATRYQLAAGGALAGVVGATTAKNYGVERGIEAGATVFPLPIVLPERLARGFFAGLTAERRLRAELLTEPRVEAQQPRVELPTMQDVKMYMLLTRRTFSDVVADMARKASPEERRELFERVAEMALDKIRAGYDRGTVLAVLRSVRSKLDPALRAQFNEVLRQYGLFGREPEYQLTDEAAALLARFLEEPRRVQLMPRVEPEPRSYMLLKTLSDPGARRIQLMIRSEPEPRSYQLMPRVEPQYALPPDQLLYRSEPRAVARLDQLYVTTPTTAQASTQRATQRTATTPLQTPTTTGKTTPVQTTVTTPPPETPPRTPPPDQPPGTPPPRTPPDRPPSASPPETPPRTPPYTPPHIPPWMLYLPASAALPLLAQMGLRLPPPPNPNMPLGAYLRMLRFPALGRQREVFVLI